MVTLRWKISKSARRELAKKKKLKLKLTAALPGAAKPVDRSFTLKAPKAKSREQALEQLRGTRLQVQQPALGLQPAAVAHELAAGADHAVAGHHDRDRVAAVRGAHRAR